MGLYNATYTDNEARELLDLRFKVVRAEFSHDSTQDIVIVCKLAVCGISFASMALLTFIFSLIS